MKIKSIKVILSQNLWVEDQSLGKSEGAAAPPAPTVSRALPIVIENSRVNLIINNLTFFEVGKLEFSSAARDTHLRSMRLSS